MNKMVRMACRVLGLAVLAYATWAAGAETKTLRLMTVGNSFSANATRYLPSLATAGGHQLIHNPLVIGGASLQLHLEKAELFERSPTNRMAVYSGWRSLRGELRTGRWDVVTIQQASIKSHDLATYRPYAPKLLAYIRSCAPKQAVYLHETWPYRCDDPRFQAAKPSAGEPATQADMYRGLTNAYRTIAAELGLPLIPVGEAFYLADTDPTWGYRPDTNFNRATAQAPALPDQTHSLHVGWRWNKKDGKDVLGMDGHHANQAGEYLGACVFYEVLYRDSVVGNPFVPSGLDPAYARFLQETAHRAVAALASP